MKKKIAILTINDNNNYGNRLQNYAVSYVLNQKLGCDAETIENIRGYYNANIKKRLGRIKRNIRKLTSRSIKNQRFKNFWKFNFLIKTSTLLIDEDHVPTNINDKYDYFIVGSDQVWNPLFERYSNVDLLSFALPQKRISFSASLGISELPVSFQENMKNEWKKFKAISVREDAGKSIIENLTKRSDVQVLIDPTMLLDSNEWNMIAKKPKQLHTDMFILNYFLGELSEEKKAEIERVADEKGCQIINILDRNSPFYACGPSEFLYLEKHAQLICTDSFHSCVFAILFNRPFIVFERQSNHKSMNSRIDTLLSKFELQDRKFNQIIKEENLSHDYTNAYNILEIEREKVYLFLTNNLEITLGEM